MSTRVRDAVLPHALAEIAEHGLSDAALKAAAEKAGVNAAELKAAFPNGAASLAEAFSHWADERMVERVRSDPAERMRERVAHAVKTRLDVLAPHKDAARRTAAFLALPQNAPLAASLMMRSVDLMWRAAGDRSSDFSYYTKRALLGGVYGATLIHFLSDSSEGHADTWTFLDSRIDDVMQIEKFRGAAREWVANLPDPLGIFGKGGGGRV
jgi:ubiquinone biosynthesis protein COQ9